MIFLDRTKVRGTARWLALDPATMALLEALRDRIAERQGALGKGPTGEEYLYSYKADHTKPGSAGYLSKRFKDMGKSIGIDTHPHALRHYAATELIVGGVGIVDVAHRLGYKSPSTTTDIYAAWRPEVDQRAAALLAGSLTLPDDLLPAPSVRDRSAEQTRRTAPELEQRICDLRQRTGWGPKRIKDHLAAEHISIDKSTVWKVLRRRELNAAARTPKSHEQQSKT